MKRAYLTGLLITIHFLNAYSQDLDSLHDTLKISLSDLWLKAEQNSRAVRISSEEVKISYEETKDVVFERLPEIGVKGTAEKASNIPIYDNGLLSPPSYHDVIHNLYRVGAEFYLNIYNGNKLNLKIEENKILNQISQIEKDESVSRVRYRSASLFLELQKSIIFLNLIKEDIAYQEKQLTEIEAFYKNGVILKSDVLRVELDLSKRKMMLVQIETDILILNQKINIIIGERDDRIIYPLLEVVPTANELSSYVNCLKQAFEHSFTYHISEQRTEISKIHLKLIKANVRPKIGLYGDFYYANPQIFLFPYNPYWYSLGIAGVRASFPISSLYHNIHKVKGARLELDKEEELHKDTEDKVRQQVKEAYLRYKEALIQIEVAQVNLAHAAENARIIKDTYFHQTSLITDLLDADVQVIQTKFELASAKIIAQTKYYLLQNIIGTL